MIEVGVEVPTIGVGIQVGVEVPTIGVGIQAEVKVPITRPGIDGIKTRAIPEVPMTGTGT
jgi:hypothetical protein